MCFVFFQLTLFPMTSGKDVVTWTWVNMTHSSLLIYFSIFFFLIHKKYIAKFSIQAECKGHSFSLQGIHETEWISGFSTLWCSFRRHRCLFFTRYFLLCRRCRRCRRRRRRTVWKFDKFTATQILCETNFGESRSSKSAIFAVLEALELWFW